MEFRMASGYVCTGDVCTYRVFIRNFVGFGSERASPLRHVYKQKPKCDS